ncbi:MAG: hypothetical protein US49_C0001G0075 [candidate division TM6 bacterium GW2011_GWF2_37_49]|nr:MAG: hypothetical protein US49_C0001G0075 [candidate division TM6 bacterium GW2011_GWF2_37_49]
MKINIFKITALLSFVVVGMCSAMSDNSSYNVLEQYYQQLDYATSVLPRDYKFEFAKPSEAASTSESAASELLTLDRLKEKLAELNVLCKQRQAAVAKNNILTLYHDGFMRDNKPLMMQVEAFNKLSANIEAVKKSWNPLWRGSKIKKAEYELKSVGDELNKNAAELVPQLETLLENIKKTNDAIVVDEASFALSKQVYQPLMSRVKEFIELLNRKDIRNAEAFAALINQILTAFCDPAIEAGLAEINQNLGDQAGLLAQIFDKVMRDAQAYELAMFKFEIFKFRYGELKNLEDAKSRTKASDIEQGRSPLDAINFDEIKKSITPTTSLESIFFEGRVDLSDYFKKDLKNYINAENKPYDVLFVHNYLKAINGDKLAADQVLHNLDMLDYCVPSGYFSGGKLKWIKNFITSTLNPEKSSDSK